MNDLPALEVDEEEDEDGAEASIKGLNEVAAPGDVILEERAPLLAVAGNAPGHVALHGALGDVDSDLEELAAKSLGPPSGVAGGHLANGIRVPARLAAFWAGAPVPEEAKARAVPSQDGGRLDHGQSCAPRRRGDGHASDEPSLRGGEVDVLALEPALRRNQLLAQQLVFGDERHA